MTVVVEAFSKLFGELCWSVRLGYATALMIEFGAPRLEVQEPRRARPKRSDARLLPSQRRCVDVCGNWSMLIESDWRIHGDGKCLAHADLGDESEEVRRAMMFLDGQRLTGVEFDAARAHTVLKFGLGCELSMSPGLLKTEEDCALWMLFEPSGQVVEASPTGRVRRIDKNARPSDDAPWGLDDAES